MQLHLHKPSTKSKPVLVQVGCWSLRESKPSDSCNNICSLRRKKKEKKNGGENTTSDRNEMKSKSWGFNFSTCFSRDEWVFCIVTYWWDYNHTLEIFKQQDVDS